MKSKSLENILAQESGFYSDMVTRFQKLRDSSLLSRARGRNAEFLTPDEVVSGILSMVAFRPGFAAVTAIGLRKLKPVGVPEDAFAAAPSLARAIQNALEDSQRLESVKEIRLGDSDPKKGMATTASITYADGEELRITQYVPQTALSLFQKGKERDFDRRSLGLPVARELVLSPRLLRSIAKEMERAKKLEELEQNIQIVE